MQDAEILWNYHNRVDLIEKSNSEKTAIIGLGSYDLRVATHCANLYLQGYGKRLLFSGKSGNWTLGRWTLTEAEIFASKAAELGVSIEEILLEKEATNIGDNILKSKNMLHLVFPDVEKIILVTKPNTTRRAYATFMVHWPQMNLMLSAPDLRFNELAEGQQTDDLINELVGDIDRIINYPDKGYQIQQQIPDAVHQAYERLRNSGFIKHCQQQVRKKIYKLEKSVYF
jgi:hypothetical protein